MHFEGTVDIAAPRERVWAFVIDPNQVGQCGPGVESIEVIDDTHFKATAKVGIGLLADTQTRILFRQPTDQIAEATELLGLSEMNGSQNKSQERIGKEFCLHRLLRNCSG